jgi:hypothetical protein
MLILDAKVNKCLLLLFSFTFLCVDPTTATSSLNVRAYRSRSAHSRSSDVGPPTTSVDEEMKFEDKEEDEEEDDGNELVAPRHQVSEVCL